MSKVKIIYWSGTGNTQKMAEAVEKASLPTENRQRMLSAS